MREEQRVGANTRITWYLHPDNQGGLFFEQEITNGGTPTNRHFVAAAAGVVAVLTTQGVHTVAAAQTITATHYWHRDHLGSLAAMTDAAGAVTRYAYDPFGKRRFVDWRYDATGTLVIEGPGGADRGFTGHEHLDDIGIMHMNGRLYDPHLGRFMQPDTFIQDIGLLQNFNRYSYVLNNPLNAVDPSGMIFKKIFKGLGFSRAWNNKYGRIVIAIGVSYVVGPWASQLALQSLGSAAVATGGGWTTQALIVQGISGGAAAGFASSLVMTGGDLRASIRGGFIGGLSGGAFGWAGSVGSAHSLGRYLAHGIAGCATAVAEGGGCGHGAASGIVGKGVTNAFGRNFVSTVVAGGLTAELTGGSFENGAKTAAFGYLFNDMAEAMKEEMRQSRSWKSGFHEYGNWTPCTHEYCTEENLVKALKETPAITPRVRGRSAPIVGLVDHIDGERSVLNRTIPRKHPLDPGVVNRSVQWRDGVIGIATYGVGWGLLPRINEKFSRPFWRTADKAIIGRIYIENKLK